MAITRFTPTTDPFAPLLENLMGPLTGATRGSSLLRAPEADVLETEDEIRVEVEMPGMRSEDIDVDLENNVLTITGEKKAERAKGDESSTWHLSERRYGRFTRSFVLPRDVEQDRIEAEFTSGVLSVRIPKSERARRRRVEVRGVDGRPEQVEARAPEQTGS
jgi:HSP20 family protein